MRLKSIEECSAEERTILSSLKNSLTQGRGVPVGLLGGGERPVFLIQGELVLFRRVVGARRADAYDITEMLSSLFRSIPPPFFVEIARSGELWYGRRFFESTLEDQALPSHLSKDEVGRCIVEVFTPLLSGRKVHGHISPSNLAFYEGELYLFDGGLSDKRAVSPQEEWENIVALVVKIFTPYMNRAEITTLQRKGLAAQTIQDKMLWLESFYTPLASPSERPSLAEEVHRKQFELPLPSRPEVPLSRPTSNSAELTNPSIPVSNVSKSSGTGFVLVLIACVVAVAVWTYRSALPIYPRSDESSLTGWARGDVRAIGDVLDEVAQNPSSSLVEVVEKDFNRDLPWGFEIDPRPFFLRGVGKVSHTADDISASIAVSVRREDLLTESRLKTLSAAGVLYVCGAIERQLEVSSADSIRKLQTLPSPLGDMFQLVAKLGDANTLTDTRLRVLCRLSWGVSESVPEPLIKALLTFDGKEQIQAKAALMILALAKLSQINAGIPVTTRSVLRTMAYPDLVAREKWFADFPEIWSDVQGAIVLELIAGRLPDITTIPLTASTDLSSYPQAEINAGARKIVIEQVSGIQKEGVGNALAAPKLTRPQKTLLISSLKSPKDVQYGFFQKWFTSEPDPETVLTIVSKGGFPESFNINAVRYLQSKKIAVSMKILPDLLVHSDKVVRAFGYALIPTDTQAGMELLRKAIAFEKDPKLKGRLEGLLKN